MTPAQMAVALICGKQLPRFAGFANTPLSERIKIGRDELVRMSGVDFGYDLAAWHDHLKRSRDGGYTWASNIVLPRIMNDALASEAWRHAVRQLEADHAAP